MVLVGLAAGVMAGLFGVGGGIISVPFVLFLAGIPFREAVAVSLVAIAITTPMGVVTHARAGNVRASAGLALALGGFLGVAVGDIVDPYLEERHLMWAFAAFLVYAAHRVTYGGPRSPDGHRDLPFLAAVGVGAGLIAKLLGIGGGILMVPGLIFAGFTVHVAVATSLVAVFTNAAASTFVNLARIGWGEWLVLALPLSLGSWLGVWVGSRTSIKTRSETLAALFSVLLLLVALSLVSRSL